MKTSPHVLVAPLLAAALYACASDVEEATDEPANAPNESAPVVVVGEDHDAAEPLDDDAAVEMDGGATEPDSGDEVTPDASVDALAHDDSGTVDAAFDARPVDATVPDVIVKDASVKDAIATDATTTDASVKDASIKDAAPDVREASAPDSGPPLDCTKVGPEGEPLELGCTTLYSSWPTRTIASTARPFTPAYSLWSDGADKSRWIELPAGGVIDATDPDEWVFPVGTRLYKEFRLQGRRVETRMLWKKTASQWVRVTYAWTYDQTKATVLRTGAMDVWGTSYEIPAQSDCETCHMGKVDGVLGFELVGLSNAGASGYVLSMLASEKRIAPVPAAATIPGNATEKAALGMLHSNCGLACHNASNYALAKSTGLFMRIESDMIGSVTATNTYKTAVNVPSKYQPYAGAGLLRIKPKDLAHSAIHFRASSRDKDVQMPPQETHLVDAALVNAIASWINSL